MGGALDEAVKKASDAVWGTTPRKPSKRMYIRFFTYFQSPFIPRLNLDLRLLYIFFIYIL